MKIFFSILLLAGLCKQMYAGSIDPVAMYPPTTDAIKSERYQLKVNNKEAFVEALNKFDVPIHYTHFAIDGKSKVTIEIDAKEKIASYSISPLSKNIKGIVAGQHLQFTISKPQYLVITINGKQDLFVLIDSVEDKKYKVGAGSVKNILDYGADSSGIKIATRQIQKAIDEAAVSRAVLYFPRGIYKTGQLQMRSNVSIYLEGGAKIKGSVSQEDYAEALIRFDSVKNVRITGPGIIDGSGWDGLKRSGDKGLYLLYLSKCDNVLIDGPVLRDPCFWNTRVYKSKNILLTNVKLLNNRPLENWSNTDGVDFDSSTDCDVVNAFLYCGDDNMVVKGLDEKEGYNTERIRFDRVVTISNSAAAKIGTETSVKKFDNIVFENIDVIKCKRAMAINGYDSAVISNVVFSNFKVEGFVDKGVETPKLIEFEITDSSWRPCVGKCKIEKVTIRNVRVYKATGIVSRMYGRTNDYGINEVLIKNVTINGKMVLTLEDAAILKNDFVRDIKVEFQNSN